MSTVWNVKVDERPYCIRLKSGSVLVNDEKLKLRSCLKKRGWLQGDYEVQVGSKTAMLYIATMVGGTKLVIDGKDCATGKDYVPVSIPPWSYVFLILHLLNFMNGMIGVIAAILGCSVTVSISSNQKFNLFVKILLNLATLILAYVLIFGLAYAMYSI